MKIYRFFMLWFLCFFASACAPVINQMSLKKPAEKTSIVFINEFHYDVSKEIDLPRPEPGSFRGLLKGRYAAAYEDENGIFYQAEGPCVIIGSSVLKGLKWVQNGGVWIEKNTVSPKFRLYKIANSNGGPLPIAETPLCSSSSRENPLAEVTRQPNLNITTPVAGAKPIQASAGNAIAQGMIEYLVESERGKIVFVPKPVEGSNIWGEFFISPSK